LLQQLNRRVLGPMTEKGTHPSIESSRGGKNEEVESTPSPCNRKRGSAWSSRNRKVEALANVSNIDVLSYFCLGNVSSKNGR